MKSLTDISRGAGVEFDCISSAHVRFVKIEQLYLCTEIFSETIKVALPFYWGGIPVQYSSE